MTNSPTATHDAAANLAALEASLAKMMARTLFNLQVLSATPASLPKMQSQLDAQFSRWLKASLNTLVAHGLATQHSSNDSNEYSAAFSADDTERWQQEWQEGQKQWQQDLALAGQLNLLNKTLDALPDILRGNVLATDILFAQSSVDQVGDVYKDGLGVDQFNQMMADMLTAFIEERVEQAQGQSEAIRILEIGAGTGGTSRVLLDALQPYRQHVAEYLYTDISLAFMMHAEKAFQPQNPFLKTQLFNVEKPPAEQNIALGNYDIVVATNVLHATSNIRNTLRNAKAVMSSGGWILINEMSLGGGLIMHLTFGLLKGWWLYEDEELRIPGSPALLPATWERVLSEEGFESVFFPAEDAHDHGTQIIVAESDGIVRQQRESAAPMEAATCKQEQQQSHTQAASSAVLAETSTRASAATQPQTVASPIAGQVSEEQLSDHIRLLIRESICESLNMEAGDIIDSRSFSDYGIDSIVGVNVVNLINERCDLLLQTTVLFDYTNVNLLTAHIVQEHREVVASQLTGANALATPTETPTETPTDFAPLGSAAVLSEKISPEPVSSTPIGQNTSVYAEQNPAPSVASRPASSQTPAVQPTQSLNANELLKVQLNGPGALSQLQFVTCPQQPLQPQEVRVATRAFALNFGDLLCVKGLYPTMPPYPFTPGFEVAGEVLEVGCEVEHFAVGDRVIASMGEALGGNATMVTCHFAQLFKIPDALSFEQASALPSAAITMIAAFHRADLMPGDTILIQTAAGGTGLIAVQLAKHYQANIIATAGSAQKLEYLRGLGVQHLVNYREQDFEQEVLRITEGRGVDAVINTLSGDAIQKGMNCLADGGRYVEIAMTAIKSARNIDLSVLSDNQAFFSIDLRKLSFSQPQRMLRYRDEMWHLVEQGIIQPTICKTFPFEQLHDAYRCMEDRQNIGKIVVSSNAHALATVTSANQVQSAANTLNRTPEIAVIGMSCRYASTESPSEFWSHLANGDNLVSPVNRWDLFALMGITADAESHAGICTQGSMLQAIDQFDPNFFNISGLEARYMDPQQRLFLEETWKALEDAGYAGDVMRAASCGVYVGCANGDYQSLFRGPAPAQAFWGNAGSVIPARIAYYLNLHGPALAIDTACSSSLVALHVACQALWNDEINMAIAGGVHLQASPGFFMSAGKGGMLSPHGRCFTFDHRADGFVPGEGVAALILKTVENAVADGDHIYGIIAGSGINQDGETNGITAPSAISQERLERAVYDRFNINPRHIGLMEAHGTGTKLGDPIEFNALSKAFGRYTEDTQYCALGSVKTNLGHSSNAAGITGVIKVLLALKHQQLPPSLNYEQANPALNFAQSPFFLNEQLQPWQAFNDEQGNALPRMGAVSSFGFSGTNAHVVLKEHVETTKLSTSSADKPAYLLAFSAVTEAQLEQLIGRYLQCFKQHEQLSLTNLSYTLLMGRRHCKHRLVCVVNSYAELQMQLEKWLNASLSNTAASGENLKGSRVQTAKLNDNDVREKASLKRYANQSITDAVVCKDAAQYQDHLQVVADFYLQGYALNYAELFSADVKRKQCRRMALPTYPFAKESYWADTHELSDFIDTAASASQSTTRVNTHSTAEAKLDVTKLPSPLPASAVALSETRQATSTQPPKASISLSSNLTPLPTPAVSSESNTILKGATSGGVHCYQETYFPKALPINAPIKVDSSEQTWLWILSSLDAYEQLVSQFSPKFSNLSVLVIFKLGTIDPVAMPENARAVKEDELGALLSKVLPETQNLRGIIVDWACEQDALSDSGNYSYRALWDVTRVATLYAPNLHNLLITGKYVDDHISRCYYEAMLGFVRSLNLLLPNCTVQHVLHAYEHTPAEAYQWGQQLFEEVRFGQHNGVLYRGEQRLVVDCVADAVPHTNKLLLQHGGCYLITGGMGGLGGLFARYLAEEFAAKLILVGRSSLSSEQEAQLQQLRKSAASALYVQGDIANAEKIAPQLQQAIAAVGNVDGVIHAAGTQLKRNMLEKDYSECRQVLLPKIDGTLALDKLLRDQPLKFVCYFSSSSAILGDFGMGDYGLANRFQMAYSRYREQQKLPGQTLCINWPLWEDGGMNFDDDDAKDFYLKSSGQKALTEADGIAVFSALMSSSATQVLLMAGNKKKLIQHVASAGSFVRSGKAEALASQQAAKIHAAVSARLIADIKQQISLQLEISLDKLDEDENLAEFGFDSILLTDFAKQLSTHLGIAFSPAELFNYPTISKLSGFLLINFSEQLQALFWEDNPEGSSEQSNGSCAHGSKSAASSGALKLVNMSTTQATPASQPATGREPIAIIGMAGRFPQARNIDELWQLLANGECAVNEIPKGRFDCDEYFNAYDGSADEPYVAGTMSSKWAGIVPGVDEFDCGFFEVSPREAQTMDPRQRLLLQEAWHALEDAGYGKTQISQQRIGMFVGVEQGDYQFLAGGQAPITANHEGILAARLSYFLDLTGPTLALNTACSSGLVAAHQACLNLWMNECDAALAAGVNCLLTPGPMIGMSHAGMLSSSGQCSAFGQHADGLVPAEAVAVVMLKRLSTAQADGDPIHSVITASGVNYDGKTNGITAPNGESQKALLRDVYQRNQVDVDNLGMVIAHGTGTKLGDPIEVNALSSVLSEMSANETISEASTPAITKSEKANPKKNKQCALYSTKANLGHSFAASGLVSLISLVSAIKHQQLPASVHAKPANEHIHWENSPLYVNTETKVWQRKNNAPRSGALSAFGMSGTNAHMVIEEYIAPAQATQTDASPATHLLVLSAKKAEALQEQAAQLAQHLAAHSNTDLNALSYTLLCGRFAFAHRLAVVATSAQDAQQQLQQFAKGEAHSDVLHTELPKKVAEKGAAAAGKKGALQGYGEQLIAQLSVTHSEPQSAPSADTQHAEEREKHLHALADLFVQGYQLAWSQLFAANTQRECAPGYPFLRQRYWASPPPTPVQAANDKVASDKFTSEKVEIEKLESEKAASEKIKSAAEFAVSKPQRNSDEPIALMPLAAFANGPVNHVAAGSAKSGATKVQLLAMPAVTRQPEVIQPIEKPAAAASQMALAAKVEPRVVAVTAQSNSSVAVPALKQALRASLAEMLFAEEADVAYDAQFIDLGLDSIVGVEWIRLLNRTYHIELAASDLYDHACLNDLARFLQPLIASAESNSPQGIELSQESTQALTQQPVEQQQLLSDGDDLDALLQQVVAGNVDVNQAETLLLGKQQPTHLQHIEASKPEQSTQLPSPMSMVTFKQLGSSDVSSPATPPATASTLSHSVNQQTLRAETLPVSPAPTVTHSVRQQVIASLAEALFMESAEIDIDATFTELGVDSIIGVEWVGVLNKLFVTQIKATDLYAFATVRTLAEHIQEISQGNAAQASEAPSLTAAPPVLASTSTPRSTASTLSSASTISVAPETNAANTQPNSVSANLRVKTFLRTSLADALFMQPEEISDEALFIELGLDSIIGVEWLTAINREFSLKLTISELYDFSCVGALAPRISGLLLESSEAGHFNAHTSVNTGAVDVASNIENSAKNNAKSKAKTSANLDALLQDVSAGELDVDKALALLAQD